MSVSPRDMAGSTVLVTGASGFLGRHVCRRLTELGADVHGLARRPQPPDITVRAWHQADCADVAAMRAVFGQVRPDVTWHLAGHADGRHDLAQVLPTLHGDLVSAVQVLTVATEAACPRLVLAGSFEEPALDDPWPVASSPYAAAKWAGTAYARMCHALYGTPVVIGRVFMTYGPGQRAHKVIPAITRSLLHGRRPGLASPERAVDWIYVDDTVRGLIALGATPGLEGQVLDIGSGALVSIRGVMLKLAEAVGGSIDDEADPAPPRGAERVACADVETTRARTGWRPVVSLDEGLSHTVRHLRAAASTLTEDLP